MLSNTDHLAESEAAKAREQDALRDLAEARLENELLRGSVERYCKMIIKMGADDLFLGDNPTLIDVAEAIYSAHMQVKNGTAVRSSTPPDTDTVPVDIQGFVSVKELIEKAAEHWANVADGKEADTGPCELCKRFKGLCLLDENGNMLEQPCPIYKATGLCNCDGTPFVAWREAAGDQFKERYMPEGLWCVSSPMEHAAWKMSEFLEMLLGVEENNCDV